MKKTLSKILVPIIATFFVVVVVYAGTTIGNNLSTSGTLSVTGATDLTGLLTFGSATGTSVTTTAYLMVGSDEGVTNLDYSDDLYVGGDTEIDGTLYFFVATGTSATTSIYLMVGDGFTVPPGFDYNEDLAVSGDMVVNGVVTSTVALWVGTGTANNLDLTSGDLYVQDDVEVDGGLWVDSATTTDSLSIGGYASTTGDLIVMGGTIDTATAEPTTTSGIFSRDRTNSTSTISIGDVTQDIIGCLEMVASGGEYWSCFINTNTSTDHALICAEGRCN